VSTLVPYRDRFDWFRAVSRRSELKGAPAACGFAIMDLLNVDKGYAWPSYERLAEELNLTRRTVIRAIDKLARCGFLDVTRSCGRGNANQYRLTLPPIAEAASEVVIHSSEGTIKGDIGDHKRCHPCPIKGDTDVTVLTLENLSRSDLGRAPEVAPSDRSAETSIDDPPHLDGLQPARQVAGLLKTVERPIERTRPYAQRHADDGEMERQLAEALGGGDTGAGFALVFALPEAEVDRLRNAVRFGRLTAAMVVEARLLATSAAADDGVRFGRPRQRDGPVSSNIESVSSTTLIEQHRPEPRHVEQ